MDMVQSIKCRDACLFEGYLIDPSHEPVVILGSLSDITGGIENGTDLVGTQDGVSCRRQLGAIGNGSDRDLGHLTYLLLQGHASEDLRYL